METNMNNNTDKLQQEIEELRQKYDTLIKEVKSLEENRKNMKDIVQNSYEVVQGLSKNVEKVMNELNNLNNDYEKTTSNNINNEDKMKFSMKKLFINPLRKIAVGTMQSAFLVMDKAVEGMSNAKEGFEDVVAEAQYQNKKKNTSTPDNI